MARVVGQTLCDLHSCLDAAATETTMPAASTSLKCSALAAGTASRSAVAAVPRPLRHRGEAGDRRSCAVPEGLALQERPAQGTAGPVSSADDADKQDKSPIATIECGSLGQMGADVLDVSKLQTLVMGEMKRMNEHVQRLEDELRASNAQVTCFETQLTKLAEVGRRDAVQRLELAANFARALQEERAARQEETAFLRAALAKEANKAAAQAATAVTVAEVACGAVARADAQCLADLQQRFSESLSQQHAQVALDVAERHVEAARALDARATEVTELADGMQRQASEFRMSLTKEVADIVCPILEEHLKWYAAPSPMRKHAEGVSGASEHASLANDSCQDDWASSVLEEQAREGLGTVLRRSDTSFVDGHEEQPVILETKTLRRAGSVKAQIAQVEEFTLRGKLTPRLRA